MFVSLSLSLIVSLANTYLASDESIYELPDDDRECVHVGLCRELLALVRFGRQISVPLCFFVSR